MRLLIFKVNQLGDNVVFLPVTQWLARLMPEAEITVLTSPIAAPIYQKCTPGLKVITEPTASFNGAWRRPAELMRLHRAVREVRPDACFMANDQGNVAHLLAWSSGARVRVGAALSRCHLHGLLTHRAGSDLAEHVAVQNWRIAACVLDAIGHDRSAMPDKPPAPDVSPLLAPRDTARPFVLIHPGASREYKRWPMDRFIELANRLTREIEVHFVLQNDASENALNPAVQKVGGLPLEEYFALTSRASLFIGNNSAPMNIACVCGVPGLIFNGPSPASWDPFWHGEKFRILRDPGLCCQPCDHLTGPVNHCLNHREPMACMNRWSVDTAHRIAMQLLALA